VYPEYHRITHNRNSFEGADEIDRESSSEVERYLLVQCKAAMSVTRGGRAVLAKVKVEGMGNIFLGLLCCIEVHCEIGWVVGHTTNNPWLV
jgi:hypothetical protein